MQDCRVERRRGANISALDVKGLVKALPRGDPEGKAGEYYINGFTIDYYSTLLHEW